MAKLVRLVRFVKPARFATYLLALWKLARHAQTPRAAKIAAFFVLAYAASPIDLIPDFIPVLGQLDDLILVPLGVALVVRMVPQPLWAQMLAEAERSTQKLPKSWWGAVLIVLTWTLVLGLIVWALVVLLG